MRFTVLGTGSATPDADRGPAGFLVQHGGRSWLVDGGSGTLQRLAKIGVDPRKLDGAVYSHRHPDHCADLVPLLFAMHTPPARNDDFRVWAGTGFAAYVDQLSAIYEKWITFGNDGRRGAIVREMSLDGPDATDIGGLKLVTRPAKHSAGALHLRFEADGMAFVYSGDTGPSDALVELARGAELLVCECSGSDQRPVEGHMTPSAIADLVARARPREVWLTHLFPHVNAAEAVRTVAKTGVKVRRPNDLQNWEP